MKDLHKLDKPDLIRLLRDSQQALAADRNEEKRLYHDLQVHQIELELQNRELRETHGALELARDRYADLYDFAPVGYLTLDTKGVITEINVTGSALLEAPRPTLLGAPFVHYVDRASQALFFNHLKRSREQSEIGNVVTEIALQLNSGMPRLVELESRAWSQDNEAFFIRTAMLDVTIRKQAEEHYRLASAVLESTPEGIIVTDLDEVITMVNPAFSIITGYSRDEVLGQTPDFLKSGREGKAFYAEMWARLSKEGKWEGELWNRRKNGEIYPQWLMISEIRNALDEVTHYVGVFNDITSQQHIRERLHQLAYSDPVTGVANREMLQDKFDTLLSLSQRHQSLLAVLFLDLDKFKQVNDTFGHIIGDKLLKETADRLLSCVRKADIVARQGGDEFVMVLTDLMHQDEIKVVAEKIVYAFETPFMLEQNEVYVTASIGISICPRDGDDFPTLLRNADAAMYNAKEAGRNNFQFFRASLADTATERLMLSRDLRRAIEQQQIAIYYQPMISMHDGQLIGIEALARWNHPEFGAVAPQMFITVAEETGYIRTLSEWITEQALSQWQTHFMDLVPGVVPRLSVNVSSVLFKQQNIYDWIVELLSRKGVEPHHLELEITESILMQNVDQIQAILYDIDHLGVSIALDDFGTGYASLSYLPKFPIRTVKIDRSFIQNITQDEKQFRLVRAINRLGQDMELNVVAEGVETELQQSLLREMGCDLMQGNLLCPPKPAEELVEWFKQRSV